MFKLSLAFAVSSVVGQVSLTGFCDLLEAQCMSTYGINTTICQTAFSQMTFGNLIDVDTNTLGCRMKFLRDPYNTTTNACRYAGATGGGRCGAPLDGLCDVAFGACGGNSQSAYANQTECKAGLAPLASQWGYKQGASAENSLECRAYHAIASLALGSAHCAHFNLTTSVCSDPVTPNPTYYCQTLQYNCNGTNLTQFTSDATCNATAMGYVTSVSDSAQGTNKGNSLGCRAYHAQAALSDPNLHCQHAGPSGGGYCGTYGEAWASMALAACNDSSVFLFTQAMNSTLDAVVSPAPAGGGAYSNTLDTSGNTQACRIYHLGVASTTPSHCAHGGLTGGDFCGSVVGNLCDLIGNVCTWGNNATFQFASRAACVAALNNTAMGTPGAATGDSLACRYYHAGVAGSYRMGGAASGNATTDPANVILHCSHVIANATSYCTAPVGPTPGATSSAPTLSLAVPAALAIVSIFA